MMATTPPVEDLRRSVIDEQATALTRARYQRLSAIYDLMEGMAEARYRPWREKLWALVKGPRVLEVGVGTGKNMPYLPKGLQMTGIDLTPGMLEIAHRRATRLGLTANPLAGFAPAPRSEAKWAGPVLRLGDAQALEFPDASFDAAVATFVFCSVPDPLLGLHELGRVVKPGGQILLLEHVRSANPILGAMMDMLNPLVVRVMGANINRRTVENVRAAGLHVESVEDLRRGIFKLIVARVGNGTDLGGPA
ncbi:MAG: methyltransferase 11 protein [Anaerolineales bacterium]|nr:methyltransferase 11 protein [Anaerolineales bacterium]